jgi:hypothetical protein
MKKAVEGTTKATEGKHHTIMGRDPWMGWIAEHCRIDNKTEDDRVLTLVCVTEPRSISHHRGRDTIGG